MPPGPSPFVNVRTLHRAATRTFRLPVAEGLSYLESMSFEVPPREPQILSWAGEAYGLDPDQIGPWFARAWWGAAASRLIRLAINRDRSEEVSDLFVDRFSINTLDLAAVPLLAGSHTGPMMAARHVLEAAAVPPLVATRSPNRPADRNLLVLRTAADRSHFLTTSLLRLRAGEPVYAGADGRWGTLTPGFAFMGRPVSMATSLPRLIRATGVGSSLFAVVWKGRELAVRLETLPRWEPGREAAKRDPGSWPARWIGAYLAALERMCLEDPANLRLHGGLWKTGSHGVFH